MRIIDSIPSRKVPHYIAPMLAKEVPDPFDDPGWIYEIKWDGYRAVAEVNKNDVKLYSRNGNAFDKKYPFIVEELKKMKLNAVLDGEVVALDDNGIPRFQLLQHYEESPDVPLCYYVFDLLELNGEDLKNLPLTERKKRLHKLLEPNDTIRYSDHIEAEGKAFFKMAVRKKLEGIMAKKADSIYSPNHRTANWLKIKHHHTQEVIIAGYTEPTGSRKYFGALVLGLRKGKKLVYAGHTGTGFTQQLLKEIYHLLQPLVREKSPFDEKIKTNMPVTWVDPVLVAEIKFSEQTREGLMRHPVFLRWRDDKQPKEITMETEKKKTVKKAPVVKAAAKKMEIVKKEPTKKAVPKELSLNGHKVTVTNPGKIFWPEKKITKEDVVNYYLSVSSFIMPYLKNRPQSLKRNPNGIRDAGFFHKDAGEEAPDWVKSIPLFSTSANKDVDYILCNNQATLTYLNNLGCIEINPWHSTIQALDKPDYLVIDIDPSPKNTFEQVIETAQVVHEVLKKAGAEGFCKTSGATGLHIYIPARKKYTYDQAKDFVQIICMLVYEQLPSFTSMERNLKKRGNKIYLDHLQNRQGQTISSVYSLRPVAGATVSTPLLWKEVKAGLSPLQFDVFTLPKRLQKTGDLFSGVLGKGIDLEKCLNRLGG